MARLKHFGSIAALLVAIAAGSTWAGWKWGELRRYQRAIEEVEAEIDSGRFALAARKLGDVLSWQPESDQALYLLGECEKQRGRPEAAAHTWSRVRPTSLYAPKALLGQVEVLIEQGRFSQAERLVEQSGQHTRRDGTGPSMLMGPLYWQQGRLDEAIRLIEERWEFLDRAGQGASEQAIHLVKLHVELMAKVTPIEEVKKALDQAGRADPDDDRVWLGKANLAVRRGDLASAGKLLDDCVIRRPDDFPVWRARLKWAMAAGHVAEAQEALAHLPAAESTPAEVRKLEAWFAARRGEFEAEHRALERALVEAPSDAAARNRVIELATKSRRADLAAKLREEKTIIEHALAQYHKLYRRDQPLRDAYKMARLAEQLGRWFEARAFLTVALALHPEHSEWRDDLVALKRRTDMTSEQGARWPACSARSSTPPSPWNRSRPSATLPHPCAGRRRLPCRQVRRTRADFSALAQRNRWAGPHRAVAESLLAPSAVSSRVRPCWASSSRASRSIASRYQTRASSYRPMASQSLPSLQNSLRSECSVLTESRMVRTQPVAKGGGFEQLRRFGVSALAQHFAQSLHRGAMIGVLGQRRAVVFFSLAVIAIVKGQVAAQDVEPYVVCRTALYELLGGSDVGAQKRDLGFEPSRSGIGVGQGRHDRQRLIEVVDQEAAHGQRQPRQPVCRVGCDETGEERAGFVRVPDVAIILAPAKSQNMVHRGDSIEGSKDLVAFGPSALKRVQKRQLAPRPDRIGRSAIKRNSAASAARDRPRASSS